MSKPEIRVGGPPMLYGHPKDQEISWKEAVTADRINQERTAIKPKKNEEIIAVTPPVYGQKQEIINADSLVDMGKVIDRLRKEEAEYRKKREAGIVITDEKDDDGIMDDQGRGADAADEELN